MINKMAELLHNAGINAHTIPTDKSSYSWNKYRHRIASELISRGVKLPDAMHTDGEGRANFWTNEDESAEIERQIVEDNRRRSKEVSK